MNVIINLIRMETLLRNFYSVLRRFRLATFFNVASLTVAFIVFLVLMMQVTYELGFDRFHKHADSLYRLEITHGEWGGQTVMSRPLIEAFIASSPHILKGALLNGFVDELYITVEHDGKRETFREVNYPVSSGYAELFEFPMVEGSREALNIDGQVLIPESMARKFFGEHPALGQTLIGEGWTTVVGGVYRDWPGNSLLRNAIYHKISDRMGAGQWMQNNFECYLRLDNPSSSVGLIDNFKQHFQHEQLNWKEMDLRLVPLPAVYFQTDTHFDSQQQKGSYMQLRVLIGIALLIVVIAAINFTNFNNAQVPMRLRSINTQKVLGGSVGMIRFSLIIEAVGISLLAYLLALFVVYNLSDTTWGDIVVGGLSFQGRLPLISGVGLFAILVGGLAGCWPAWYITSFPPALVLNGNFGLSPKGKTLRNVLVCMQFIVSFVLIMGAMFVERQNRSMLRMPVGFDRDQVAVIDLNEKLGKEGGLLKQKLEGIPDIEVVSLVSGVVGSQDDYSRMGRTYEGNQIDFLVVQTDAYILDVLGLEPIGGRAFLPEDQLSEGVYIFNEMARKKFEMRPGGIVSLDWGDFHMRETVAGFMPDLKYNSFRSLTEPFAFFTGKNAMAGQLRQAMIRVRAGSDYTALRSSVEKELHQIDADYPLEMHLFNELQENLYQKELRVGRQIAFFSMVAVLISLIGVLGVVMFESEYKRKEVGIRKVFGATVGELLTMFNKTYLRITTACFVISVPLAYYAILRWQENFAYKVPLSWWIFVLAFLMVTVITLATVTIQNWQVANANPVDSIKSE